MVILETLDAILLKEICLPELGTDSLSLVKVCLLLVRLLLICKEGCLCPGLVGAGVMVMAVSSLHLGRSLTRIQFLRPGER